MQSVAVSDEPPSPLLPLIATGPIRIELQPVASGLTSPVLDLMPARDGTGRLFLMQQKGKVLILKNGAISATPFLDVSSRLVPMNPDYDERGLLGLAFHPGFSDSSSVGYRKLYTVTSEPVSGTADFTVPIAGGFNHQVVIAEWQTSIANPDIVDLATRREIMRIDHPQDSHNGGTIAFRSSESYLYISTGDGGGANDSDNGHTPDIGNAQDITNVLGKILRIDPIDPALTPASPNAASANNKYRIPANNPFVGQAGLDEIYAYGLRHPYRFSVDTVGDRVIAGDVGQNRIEEIDIIEAGKNYGWHNKEGTFLFNSDGTVSIDDSPDPSLTNPVAEYCHDDGHAVIGGFVYHGTAIPALAGKYVFGDFVKFGLNQGRLFYTNLADGVIRELRIGLDDRTLGLILKSLGQDDNGEIYVLADTTSGFSASGAQGLKIVPFTPSPALLNLSARANVGINDDVLIGGFILTGSAPKKVVLRAIGPSLVANNQSIPGRLADPMLELHSADGSLLSSNDDWTASPDAQEIVNDNLAPSDSHESALVASLEPGNYTAILRGVGNTTGIGLVELYDVTANTPANANNISARGHVGSGDDVMIAGFIIGGSQSRNVLIRVVGPSLAAAGVQGTLQDPILELHDHDGAMIASNDNWKVTQQPQIEATGLAPTDDREAAILASSLSPGSYTAIAAGAANTTGVALVEVYQLH